MILKAHLIFLRSLLHFLIVFLEVYLEWKDGTGFKRGNQKLAQKAAGTHLHQLGKEKAKVLHTLLKIKKKTLQRGRGKQGGKTCLSFLSIILSYPRTLQIWLSLNAPFTSLL